MRYLLAILLPVTVFAQELSAPMSFEQAKTQSLVQFRCLLREDGMLFRLAQGTSAQEANSTEQCSVDTGWVRGPVVTQRINSEESKRMTWQVTTCRCQHD